MKKKILAALLALALVGTGLTACGSQSSGQSASADNTDSTSEDASADSSSASGVSDDELVIALQPSGAFIPLIIAREKGYVEEALQDYDIEVKWTDFESGPPINEAMAAGEADVGALGDVPAVSAIAAGQNNSLAFMTTEGSRAYAILVAADSDITDLSQLKGKTLATVVGSTGHNLFEKALAKEGLSLDTDATIVNINAGDAATVLENGEADAVAIWEPNVTRLTESGVAKVLAYGEDVGLLGPNQIMINTDYANANPTVVEALKEAYEKGIEDLETLSEDEETLKAVADYLSLDEDQVLTVAGNWDYKTEVSQDDIDALNDTIDFLVKIGNLQESYDISEYIYNK
jgi:sulfonate transport system substrate-binding protein